MMHISFSFVVIFVTFSSHELTYKRGEYFPFVIS